MPVTQAKSEQRRLQLYDLVERKVPGDGNCQNQWVKTDFNIKETAGKAKKDTKVEVPMVQVNNSRLEIHLYWAGKGSYTYNRGPLISAMSVVPSDQLYRSADHHGVVREQIVQQLRSNPEMYEGYVPMAYVDYLKKMSKNGEWGDHVTLQAAADKTKMEKSETLRTA